MGSIKAKVHLTHLELTGRDGEVHRLPWACTCRTKPVWITDDARKATSELPRSFSLSGDRERRIVSSLQHRARRMALRDGTHNKTWDVKRPNWLGLWTFTILGWGAFVLMMFHYEIWRVVDSKSWVYSQDAPRIAVLIAWVAVAFFVIWYGVIFAVPTWMLIRSAAVTYFGPRLRSFRTDSRAIHVTYDDGRTVSYPWADLTAVRSTTRLPFGGQTLTTLHLGLGAQNQGEWAALLRAVRAEFCPEKPRPCPWLRTFAWSSILWAFGIRMMAEFSVEAGPEFDLRRLMGLWTIAVVFYAAFVPLHSWAETGSLRRLERWVVSRIRRWMRRYRTAKQSVSERVSCGPELEEDLSAWSNS